jgi:hypothetical protein
MVYILYSIFYIQYSIFYILYSIFYILYSILMGILSCGEGERRVWAAVRGTSWDDREGIDELIHGREYHGMDELIGGGWRRLELTGCGRHSLVSWSGMLFHT